MQLETVCTGVDFGEGPRWHENRLWYSDFYQNKVYAVSESGDRETMVEFPDDEPSGLGWLPGGDLLIVSMRRAQIWRVDADGNQSVHCDLSSVVDSQCNDMVVDHQGNAYVGNFGYDMQGGEEPKAAILYLVRPDGSFEAVADDLRFPNGAVITPDGKTLILGETFGGRYTAWDINFDATLSNRRVWAETPGYAPDGCCLDADGAIWFACAVGQKFVRILEGGEITDVIDSPQGAYACMLGGSDGKTLFGLTAAAAHPDEARGSGAGHILRTKVSVGHAGRP